MKKQKMWAVVGENGTVLDVFGTRKNARMAGMGGIFRVARVEVRVIPEKRRAR